MATGIGLDRVKKLLQDASAKGCSVAWVEDGALVAGASVTKPRFVIDFARERLTAVDDTSDLASAGTPKRRHLKASPPDEAPLADRDHGPLELYQPDLIAAPGRRRGNYALIVDGKIVPAISSQSLLLSALQTLEMLRPGTLDKLSGDAGRTKRVVARERSGLYANPALAKHAKQIDGGWWVATNNNRGEVEKFIRRAAFHAGLDVEIRS